MVEKEVVWLHRISDVKRQYLIDFLTEKALQGEIVLSMSVIIRDWEIPDNDLIHVVTSWKQVKPTDAA